MEHERVQPVDDRLWRHPSEDAKFPSASTRDGYYAGLQRTRRFLLITAFAAAGVFVALGILLMENMNDPRAPRHDFQPVVASTVPSVVFVNGPR